MYIQDDMQNTVLYGHLYWSNNIVYLDKLFDINNYIEHIVECPQCHQKYSDMFSNFAPSKNRKDSICSLCDYRGFINTCGEDNTCNYSYQNEVNCNDCFFNGGNLDPRMSGEENAEHVNELKDYYELNKEDVFTLEKDIMAYFKSKYEKASFTVVPGD